MNKHFRSLLSMLLALVLLAGALPMTAAAASTPFTDVSSTDWYAAPVMWAVENNITGGIGNGQFGPNNPCTRAQVVTFLWAANGKPEPKTTINPFADVPIGAWYLKPVLWAVEQGITGGTSANTFSPEQECTRAQIVTFLYAAAGKPAVSSTKSEFIDVLSTDWFVKPVIWAKENDITGGTGPNTFGPLDVCTRGQVVTFLFKAYGDSSETTPTPTTKPTPTPTPTPKPTPTPTAPPKLNAEQIYAKCAPAVFYIEIYNKQGQAVSSGSGVFLNSDGLAITNHHVIDDAYSAKIMTTDGKVYNVKGYYDARESIDLALIQIDGSNFNYLPIGDYASIAGGQIIFAIGSPKGFDNTISTGIISNPKRLLNGIDFIQMTAPISPGSSGGALINDKGQLIGINTAYYEGGQNLNLAVPIYHKDELSTVSLKTLPIGSGTPTDYGASMRFEPTLTVTAGSSVALGIFCERGNYNGNMIASYDISNEQILSAQWDDWYGDDVNLYITGLTPGTATVTITLLTEDKTVLASGTLTVTVTAPVTDYGASRSFAPTLTLAAGTAETVWIGNNPGSYTGELRINFAIADPDIVSAEWSAPIEYGNNLSVIALAEGTTTIRIFLTSTNGTVLASESLTVTVTDSETDYGASISFEPNLTIKCSDTGVVRIYADEGSYPRDVSIGFNEDNGDITYLEWGEWEGSEIDLYVTGEVPGKNNITISLKDSETGKILVSKSLSVTVTEAPATLSFTPSLTVEAGKTGTVHITASKGSYQNPVTISYDIANPDIVSAKWSEWDDWDIDLFVTGLAAGTTNVTIALEDTETGKVLVAETLTVTVTEPANRGQKAFVAMRDWIKANYNDIMDGSYVYSEVFYEDGGQFECALIYTPGDDYIDVAVWTDMGNSYISTYIDLDPNYNDAYGFIYFYLNEYSESEPIFEGAAEIPKASFNGNTYISFYESYGDTANASDYADLLKFTALIGLDYAEIIFETYLPQYSITDFGYTNIYA